MSDVYVSSGTITGTILSAYSKEAWYAFEPSLRFLQVAQTESYNEQNPGTVAQVGSPINFIVYNSLGTSTAALSETADPTTQTIGKSVISLTLKERGGVVTTTKKLRTLSIVDIDRGAAKLVGIQMAQTLDQLAREALDGSGNAYYVSGSAVGSFAAASTKVLQAKHFREMRAKLAANNVPPFEEFGGLYVAICHPNIVSTLKNETGTGKGTLISAEQYLQDSAGLYRGVVGAFEGFMILESSRAKVTASTASVYTTYFLGEDALGYGLGINPDIVVSGPFDKLQRLMNVGWYGLVAIGRLRNVSTRLYFSASTYNNS